MSGKRSPQGPIRANIVISGITSVGLVGLVGLVGEDKTDTVKVKAGRFFLLPRVYYKIINV